MKTDRWFLTVVFLVLVFSLTQWIFGSPGAAQRQPNSTVAAKYIFFFLADGGGTAHMEITRQYNRAVHNEGLIIPDRIMKEGNLGRITTDAADSLSTDSAAAATAFASGCKAKLGVLGMYAAGSVPNTPTPIRTENAQNIWKAPAPWDQPTRLRRQPRRVHQPRPKSAQLLRDISSLPGTGT